MENPTYIALSRLMSQQRAMDVVANNIANADTPGYKSQHVQFSDWMLHTQGAVPTGGEDALDFTQDRATWRDDTPGALTHTGEPMDLALGGAGFFQVQTSNGIRLTRAGRFAVQSDGTVGDSAGNPLLDDGGHPIRVGATDRQINVSSNGTIASENGPIGKVGIVTAADANRLVPEGSHLLRADTATTPLGQPQIVQGALESSNVQPITEMTRMMQMEREFQFMTQFVQSEGDRQQSAIDTLTTTPQT